MSSCPSCGRESPEDSRFCNACGTALDATSAPTETQFGDPAGESPAAVDRPDSDTGGGARFLPGVVLAGRYRIFGLLGRGGMGEVYRSDDLKLGQPVALKFLPRRIERDPARLERFLNEVRVALRVTHPNVCRVYDIGEMEGRHFITMEYIDGEDLASLLRRIGRLPQDKAVEIGRQLCAGLAAAHGEGILHRDLKPANVMVDGRGRAKITDFGLASLAGTVEGSEIRVGTPAYMSPEQISGASVSVQSDLYALGLVLYELFTGKPAFRADSIAALERMHTTTPPSSPSEHVEGLDPAVERVVLRCLAKHPDERPRSALAVAAALPGGDPLAAALAAGETPAPELVAEAGSREGMQPLAAVLLAVVGLGLFVAATRWAGTMSILHYLPLDKRPEVLVDRAQEIVRELGFDEPVYADPVDQAWGLVTWPAVFDEVKQADDSPQRWERLRRRPDAMTFWYRQAPFALTPYPTAVMPVFARGPVGLMNPVPSEAGEVVVILDLAGNLRRLEVLPKRLSTRDAPEPDWSPLFALAGLDESRFEPTEPRYQRFQAPDRRRAWVGTREELPGVEFRVEAGSFEGRPTLFNAASSQSLDTLAQDPEPRREPLVQAVLSSLPGLLILVVLLVSIRFTRANLKRGRADRRGATRFALLIACMHLLRSGLVSDRLFSRDWVFELWPLLVGAVFFGMATWAVYVAAEPTGRQIWPHMFVSSSRLLSRPRIHWRDPLIGRSVLIGLVAGVLAFAVQGPLRLSIATLRGGAAGLFLYDLDLLLGQRQAWGGTVGDMMSIGMAFVSVLTLVVLRSLVKRAWLAVLLAVIVWTAFEGVGSVETLIYGLLASTIFMAVLLRWGVVAMLVATLVSALAWNARTTDWSAWHAQAAVITLVVVTALAVYGAWAAVGKGTREARA